MRSNLYSRLRARLRGESGFTMVSVMGGMLAIMGFSAVALAAASGDFGGSAYDTQSKQAYAAAEAGINDYLYHLNQDNAYWAKCTDVPDPNAVNQRGEITRRRTLSDTRMGVNGDADYAIELLPANGSARCEKNNAARSMIDGETGTFRIRSTGRMPLGNGKFAERSVITTFKRRGFLDFLYFTDYETSDPAWYELDARGRQTRTPAGEPAAGDPPPKDLVTWASENCARYWRDGRGSRAFNGQIFWFDNNWYSWSPQCTQIQFAPQDRLNGPLHTNDELLICGSPRFGRSAQDKIEVSAPEPGWRRSCDPTSPNFVGTFTPNAPILAMPPSNSKLKKLALPGYRFTGTTHIRLAGGNMFVTNRSMGLDNVGRTLPPNGVVYVEDGACGQGYRPLAPYDAPPGCGDVYIEGPYANDLTIAAEKDVIIKDDLIRASDQVLGLIANNFVRVYHPVTDLRLDGSRPTCVNDDGPGKGPGSIRIDAAVLALQHSFTVDNYFCGAPTGTLTLNGVIAQKFRGPVGTGGTTVSTGYIKDYNYDDRLSLRQPPHFLDPVQSAWRVQRQTEN